MDKISLMLSTARTNAKISQDAMASAMGVSRKTVQKWEDGSLCPNLNRVIEWFDITGEPLYPYILRLLHGYNFNGISSETNKDDIKDGLHDFVDELSEDRIRKLMYVIYCDHGSTPSGVLDLITAYLHLPLDRRVCIASAIIHACVICESTDTLRGKDHVLPDIEFLKECCNSATRAVIEGKESYMNREDKYETKKVTEW